MCERHDCTFPSCFNIDFSPWSRTDNNTGQETNSALRWHFVGRCHEVLHLPVLNAQSVPSFTWALEMRSYMAQSDELVDSTSSVQQGISVWISQETLDMEKGLPWRKGPGESWLTVRWGVRQEPYLWELSTQTQFSESGALSSLTPWQQMCYKTAGKGLEASQTVDVSLSTQQLYRTLLARETLLSPFFPMSSGKIALEYQSTTIWYMI